MAAPDEPEPTPEQCRPQAKSSGAAKEARRVLAAARKQADNDQVDAALKAARKATKLDPRNAKAHMLFAELSAKRGKVEAAVTSFKCVVHLAPDSEIARDADGRLEQFEKLNQN